MLQTLKLNSENLKMIKISLVWLTTGLPDWNFFLQSLIVSGYGPHITVINHDAADSSTQKGSAGGMGQIAGGRESGSTGSFLGPPGRIGMITGAPSPHQVLFVTSFRNKVIHQKTFHYFINL